MGTEISFYDYMEGETNLIHAWLHSKDVPTGVRQKFTNLLLHLEGTPIAKWTRPTVDTLTGVCNGLFEVRTARGHIQYRVLAHHGPGRFTATLLHGFIKEDLRVSEQDCWIAQTRLSAVYTDVRRRRKAHRYD